MGQDEWYRHTTWDARIEAAFDEQLGRAPSKAHYLRVQASTLVETHPEVTLKLLDRYFALGDVVEDDAHLATAHEDRARARLALGDVDGAAESFEAALVREAALPIVKTRAFLDLPRMIAVRRIAERYPRALGLLQAHENDLTYPRDRYESNGALALILQEQGRFDEAREAADLAVAAAAETDSGIEDEPHVGLVTSTNDEFGARVAAIAGRPAMMARAPSRPWWRFWS